MPRSRICCTAPTARSPTPRSSASSRAGGASCTQAAGWPLAGCDEPESWRPDDDWHMGCKWEVGPFRQFMALRLVTLDGERYAVRIRAMNEHRMRHLVAIANSF